MEPAKVEKIFKACANGSLDALKKFEKAQIKIAVDREGKTALHVAASEGKMEILRALLNNVPIDINTLDSDGWTPLHCAAARGHLHACLFLLEKGSNACALTSQGTTVLHYLVRINFTDPFLFLEVLDMLLKKQIGIDSENSLGETPLQQACLRGNDLAVIWLLKNKADINHADKKKLTPFHMACMSGSKSTVELLILRKANAKVMLSPKGGVDPSVATRFPEIAKLIEDYVQNGTVPKETDLERVVEDHKHAKEEKLNRFAGDTQYAVVKHGAMHKTLKLDLTQPVGSWLTFLAKQFSVSDIDEHILLMNQPNKNSAALELEQSVVQHLHVRDANEVPSDAWYELRKRRRLLAPDLKQVKWLCEGMEIHQLDRIAKPLVVVFFAAGKTMTLLQWAVDVELEKWETRTSGTLFREDSFATKVMTHFVRLVGGSYLLSIISPIVQSIASSHNSYEIDPNRPDFKKSNYSKVKELVDRVVQNIARNRLAVPLQVRELVRLLSTRVSSRVPEAAPNAVASLLFLRFICPAITSPGNYGIIEEIPTAEASRGLVICAKILQSIANGVPFGEKEAYLMKLNKFAARKTAELRDYWDFLIKESTADVAAAVVKISDTREADAFAKIEMISSLKERGELNKLNEDEDRIDRGVSGPLIG